MPISPFVIIAVSVCNLAAAEAVLDDVATLAERPGYRRIDAVSIGRKVSDEMRFHRDRPGRPARRGPVSAAAGVALALFPSAVADLPATRDRDRIALATVAGRVARPIGGRQ